MLHIWLINRLAFSRSSATFSQRTALSSSIRATAHAFLSATFLLAPFGLSCKAALEIVVTSGAPSPDGNGVLDLLNAPTINDAGQLAFVTQLSSSSGGTSDNVALLRRDTNGALTKISRSGETFNGKSILTWFPASAYMLDSGEVASVVALGPAPAQFWHTTGTGGPMTGMYTAAMPSPSGQTNTLLGVTSGVFNDSGLFVYRAVFNGAQPEAGLYQRSPDGTHSVRAFQQVAAPRGGTITSTGGRPTVNEAGQIGTILTIDHDNNSGTATIGSAARIDGTTVVELARQNDILPDGTTIGGLLPLTGYVNNSGQVAFAANYTRPGSGGQGVFLSDDSGTSLIAFGVLPGATTGISAAQVVGISDAGQVAMHIEMNGGFDQPSGIYLSGTSGATLVALEDTATPVPGKFFRSFFSGSVVLNDAGQMAFMAELSDTANGPAAGRGVFYYDPVGGLQQIARSGDALGGSTVSSVFFRGMVDSTSTVSPDTSMTGLNALGKVAFSFALTNGEDGIAIWSPTSVRGDYNGDNVVDTLDYIEWQKRFGSAAANADGNIDGVVDAADYVLWRKLAESGAGSNESSVPEPAAPLLVFVALLLCRVDRQNGALTSFFR